MSSIVSAAQGCCRTLVSCFGLGQQQDGTLGFKSRVGPGPELYTEDRTSITAHEAFTNMKGYLDQLPPETNIKILFQVLADSGKFSERSFLPWNDSFTSDNNPGRILPCEYIDRIQPDHLTESVMWGADKYGKGRPFVACLYTGQTDQKKHVLTVFQRYTQENWDRLGASNEGPLPVRSTSTSETIIRVVKDLIHNEDSKFTLAKQD
ncbi:MAG: hypothetical protein WCF65_05115 [Parachlamydiaceae bacterium]